MPGHLWTCKNELCGSQRHKPLFHPVQVEENQDAASLQEGRLRPLYQPAPLLLPWEAPCEGSSLSWKESRPLRNRGRAVTTWRSAAEGPRPGCPAQLPPAGQEMSTSWTPLPQQLCRRRGQEARSFIFTCIWSNRSHSFIVTSLKALRHRRRRFQTPSMLARGHESGPWLVPSIGGRNRVCLWLRDIFYVGLEGTMSSLLQGGLMSTLFGRHVSQKAY